jgi:DNA-binding NarL/FixJ family response regulator
MGVPLRSSNIGSIRPQSSTRPLQWDVRRPEVDGIEATREIVAGIGGPRILILTTFDLDEYAFSVLRAGASGFVLKDVPIDELARAIRAVAIGDAVVSPRIGRRLLDVYAAHLPGISGDGSGPAHTALDQLTRREQEVLLEVALGFSNTEIAEKLVMAEATVKTHVGSVPVVNRQRPPVAEEDRLTDPPALVVDLGSIAGSELGHFRSSLFSLSGCTCWPPPSKHRSPLGTLSQTVRR